MSAVTQATYYLIPRDNWTRVVPLPAVTDITDVTSGSPTTRIWNNYRDQGYEPQEAVPDGGNSGTTHKSYVPDDMMHVAPRSENRASTGWVFKWNGGPSQGQFFSHYDFICYSTSKPEKIT